MSKEPENTRPPVDPPRRIADLAHTTRLPNAGKIAGVAAQLAQTSAAHASAMRVIESALRTRNSEFERTRALLQSGTEEYTRQFTSAAPVIERRLTAGLADVRAAQARLTAFVESAQASSAKLGNILSSISDTEWTVTLPVNEKVLSAALTSSGATARDYSSLWAALTTSLESATTVEDVAERVAAETPFDELAAFLRTPAGILAGKQTHLSRAAVQVGLLQVVLAVLAILIPMLTADDGPSITINEAPDVRITNEAPDCVINIEHLEISGEVTPEDVAEILTAVCNPGGAPGHQGG